MTSLRSPKNKYQGVINFDESLADLGSVIRFTLNNIEELRRLCETQAKTHPCRITILENMAEYPSFDWREVEHYDYNK